MPRPIPAAILLVLVLLGAAPAPATASDNRNAATWYERAFAIAPRLTEHEQDLIDRYRANPADPPPAELREVLARFNGAFGHVRRGARQRYSDRALDYGQGFSLALPHLGNSRQLARAMEADALVRLHDGQTATAAAQIANMLRMSGHVGNDRIVISSLVGQAIWNAGDAALQNAIDHGLLGPGEAAVILAGVEALPPTDPFNYVEAVVMEHELAVRSLQPGEDGLVSFGELIWSPEGEHDPLKTMTADEAAAELDLYGAFIDEVVEVFVENDPEAGAEALADLDQRLEAGEFGELARLFAPAMTKAFERKIEGERNIAARTELLRDLVAGDADARQHANAAVWYLRAIAALHAKDAEPIAALRRDVAEPDRPVEPAVVSLLDGSDDVVALLREAASIARCDFGYAHEATTPPAPALAAPYAVGLRDLLRLVLADVRHRRAQGETDALMDRLRIGWSMLKHLEADPMFTTALCAHKAFERLLALTLHAVTSGPLGAEQRAELSSLANRLRRIDPFGYVAATVKAREALVDFARATLAYDLSRAKRVQDVTAVTKELPPATLLYVAAVMDTMRHAGDEELAKRRAALAPLDGLLDMDALERVRSEVPRVAPLLAQHELAPLRERPVLDIASLGRRMGEARRELGDGLRSLRPAAADAAADATNAKEGDEAPPT